VTSTDTEKTLVDELPAREKIDAVGQHGARSDAIDTITEENERDIRKAPGADAPVDPGVRDAGLRSLCRRAAYRGRAECVQFTPAE
jgi:hypothetical protein